MLWLEIPQTEYFDEVKEEFVYIKETTLQLEHSLVSLSKWESKWNLPFLGTDEKTSEQMFDYIRCMTITQNVNPLVYFAITQAHIREVSAYINEPMTATVFSETKTKGKSEVLTAEILYYYMTALGIPFECQKWHLNKLLTLIRVCNLKNAPEKKMTAQESYARNRDLNAKRKAKLNTKG